MSTNKQTVGIRTAPQFVHAERRLNRHADIKPRVNSRHLGAHSSALIKANAVKWKAVITAAAIKAE
jgi:hypothetical protein